MYTLCTLYHQWNHPWRTARMDHKLHKEMITWFLCYSTFNAPIQWWFFHDFSPISFLSTKWYRVRDGSETEISQNPKYLLSGGYHRILTIKSPETSDTGLYRCKASMSNSNLSPPVILDANLTVYGRWIC